MRRRQLLVAFPLLAASVGGDPGSGRVPWRRGGLPWARPDQRYAPPFPASVPPGRGNIVRARQVIISGAGGGEFIYNVAGTVLLYSNVNAVTTDPLLGGAVLAGTTWYQAGGVINISNGIELQYAPTAAAGHLVNSSSPTSGTDTFGNAVLPGDTTYFSNGTGFIAAQNFAGEVNLYTGPLSEAGPWTLQNTIGMLGPPGSDDLLVISQGSNIQLEPGNTKSVFVSGSQNQPLLQVSNGSGAPGSPAFLITPTLTGDKAFGIQVSGNSNASILFTDAGMAAGPGTATQDVHLLRAAVGVLMTEDIEAEVSSARETWHNLGAPIAGWSASLAQYKRLADSRQVLIEIGNLVGPAVPPADATIIFTAANGLPAGYRPSITSAVIRRACYIGGAEGGEQPALLFATDGSIQVFGVGGVGANPRLDGSFTLSTL